MPHSSYGILQYRKKNLWRTRLRRWKRFSRHILPHEICHLHRTEEDKQAALETNKKLNFAIMRDIVAIFKEIKTIVNCDVAKAG